MSDQIILRIGEAINVVKKDQGLFYECARCGHSYGGKEIGDPKKTAVMQEISIGELNKWNKYGRVDEFVVREFYCPQCGVMIAANMQQKDEDIMMDYTLD